jgi:hypothetical protein
MLILQILGAIAVILLAEIFVRLGKAITTLTALSADIHESMSEAGEQLDSIRLAARTIEKVAERFGR